MSYKSFTHHSSLITHHYLFIALLLILAWLPLPLGSNRPWAWAILEIGVFSVSLAWLYFFWRGQIYLTPVFMKSRGLLLWWGVWVGFLAAQLLPLPPAGLQTLSPAAAALQSLSPDSSSSWAPLAVEPHAATTGWLKSLSYGLLFCLVLLLVNRRQRLQAIAYTLVFSGLFQALYGSFSNLSGFNRGNVSGTFVNRNHLAAYLIICLAAGIGLLLAQWGEKQEGWRKKLKKLLEWLLSSKMRLRFYLAFMVIALVLTHSRMGNTAFLASLLLAGIIGLIFSKRAVPATIFLLASLVVIDLLIIGAWFGFEQVAQRIEQTRLTTESRDEIALDTLAYWQAYFWAGSGLGSYYAVFPHYQHSDINNYYDHAHNDYLQFAAETGVVGIVWLGVFVAASLLAVLSAQIQRRDPLCRGLAFSVLMVIIAFLIHSTVEFNLQIPAIAATLAVLLALGWISRYLPNQRGYHYEPWQPATRVAKTSIIAAMIGLGGLIILASSRGAADLFAKQADNISRQEEILSPEQLNTAQNALDWARKLDPANPLYLEYSADLFLLAAQQQSHESAHLRQAQTYLLQALRRNPARAALWFKLAACQALLNEYDALFLTSFQTAAKLGNLAVTQQALARLGLESWYSLPPQGREIVATLIAAELLRQPEAMNRLLDEYGRRSAVCAYFNKPTCL